MKIALKRPKSESEKAPKLPKLPKKEKAPKLPKQLKEPKKSKESKKLNFKLPQFKKNANSVKKEAKEQKANALFSLRNKIFACFLVPIVFMVAIGIISYLYAADGMSEKFKESAQQTGNMAIQYLDSSCTYIQSEGMGYAFDSSFEDYFWGMLGKNDGEKALIIQDNRVKALASQSANPFIYNMHLITKPGTQMITTVAGTKFDGIYDTYHEEMLSLYSEDGRNVPKWVDSHPLLDTHVGQSSNDYFITYHTQTSNKFGYVVIDVDKDALLGILQDMDFGEGSIVGYVTSSGKELISENLEEGQASQLTEGEAVFAQQEFYLESLASEELNGVMEVKYNGQDYLYIFNKSEVCGVTQCALIPMDVVTGQAEKIKTITITLVIIACIVALAIGLFITFGIQKNMNDISKGLNKVAEGDLTVKVKAHGRDEFQTLAATATNMITNNKNLVSKLNGTVDQLEVSANDVNVASEDINNYSADITRAIDEISEGMTKQAEHAQECVIKTSVLSEKIEEIRRMVEEVEILVDKTEKMIQQGTEIVKVLGERAQETSNITARVGSSIEALKTESQTINGFVEMISDISRQTNLLSLNASIEAARAGDAGRGFAVVADEIRKLADQSKESAAQITAIIGELMKNSNNSVEIMKQMSEIMDIQGEHLATTKNVFNSLNMEIDSVAGAVDRITGEVEQLDLLKNDVMGSVESLAAIAEENAASTQETSAAMQELNEIIIECKEKTEEMVGLADDLMESTSQLNLDETTEIVAEEPEEVPVEELREELPQMQESAWETDVVSEVYKTPVETTEAVQEETLDDLFGEIAVDEEEKNRVLAELGENETTEG